MADGSSRRVKAKDAARRSRSNCRGSPPLPKRCGQEPDPRAAGVMSRILIVEDEQHLADGLCFNLEAEGHDPVLARDGERAIQLVLAERQPFDVIVLDVMLPGKDGFAVAAELRA